MSSSRIAIRAMCPTLRVLANWPGSPGTVTIPATVNVIGPSSNSVARRWNRSAPSVSMNRDATAARRSVDVCWRLRSWVAAAMRWRRGSCASSGTRWSTRVLNTIGSGSGPGGSGCGFSATASATETKAVPAGAASAGCNRVAASGAATAAATPATATSAKTCSTARIASTMPGSTGRPSAAGHVMSPSMTPLRS